MAWFFEILEPACTFATTGAVVAPTLPGFCLVEYLRDHQLPTLLLIVVAEVILVHDPVRLLRLSLLPVIGVEHKDLLETSELSFHENCPRLARLVPPRLSTSLVLMVHVDLPPFPVAGCIGLGGPVKEVADVPIFAHSCRWSIEIHFSDLTTNQPSLVGN